MGPFLPSRRGPRHADPPHQRRDPPHLPVHLLARLRLHLHADPGRDVPAGEVDRPLHHLQDDHQRGTDGCFSFPNLRIFTLTVLLTGLLGRSVPNRRDAPHGAVQAAVARSPAVRQDYQLHRLERAHFGDEAGQLFHARRHSGMLHLFWEIRLLRLIDECFCLFNY